MFAIKKNKKMTNDHF